VPRLTLVEFSPSGGLFQFALQLADGLATHGWDIDLVTGPDPELRPVSARVRLAPVLPTWRPHATGVETRWVRKARRAWRAVRYLEAWRRTWRHLTRTQPDVVQFGEWRFPLDGLVVTLLARRLRGTVLTVLAHTPVPFVEQRTSGPVHKTGRRVRWALGAAYRRMDVVLVLGERSAAAVRAAYPGVRRVAVVRHGDAAALVSGAPPRAAGTPPVVLFFGTIARYKGPDLLLDAWDRVRAEAPDARLVLAGAPVDVDVDALRARAAAVGGVELRLGYVPAEDVPDLLGAARVVVAPYRTAHQSGVVHLAQTAARPVVATDVGDLSAVVRDGVDGRLVPPADPDALAAALVALLRDPAEADRLGAAGRRRVATVSWPSVAAEIVEVLAPHLAVRRGHVAVDAAR
jgi:glycosyltransferase involved in cell wall biosynthesis